MTGSESDQSADYEDVQDLNHVHSAQGGGNDHADARADAGGGGTRTTTTVN